MNSKNKYGVIVSLLPWGATDVDSKNIGDYAQSLAAQQYNPQTDELVDRELVSDFVPRDEKSKVKLIMNAWWMWHCEKWPPSNYIDPLPISMHISPLHAAELLCGDGLKWFQQHQPIGCRDWSTVSLLRAYGLDAYFSGCLTLTLYRSHPVVPQTERKGVCFVDPYYVVPSSRVKKLLLLPHIIYAPFTIYQLYKKDYFWKVSYNSGGRWYGRKFGRLKCLINVLSFYKEYHKRFSTKLLRNAEFITHVVSVRKGVDTDETLLCDMNDLLTKYGKLKLMVTSRIHAALPCLSMQTPVVFIENQDVVGQNWNGGRLSGIAEFFRCMKVSISGLAVGDDVLRTIGKITEDTTFENKDTWIPYAKRMEAQCVEFIDNKKI